MPVLTVSFDHQFQHLNLNSISSGTGDFLRSETIKFENDKEAVWTTLFDNPLRDMRPSSRLFQFGSRTRLLHLFATLVRELSAYYVLDISDPREPLDWLIEQPSFTLQLSWDDLIQGLQIIEAQGDMFLRDPELNSRWRVNMEGHFYPVSLCCAAMSSAMGSMTIQ